jgi:hypothetical protein
MPGSLPAKDIEAARLVLMRWIEHTGNAHDGVPMARRITARALELGLEEP